MLRPESMYTEYHVVHVKRMCSSIEQEERENSRHDAEAQGDSLICIRPIGCFECTRVRSNIDGTQYPSCSHPSTPSTPLACAAIGHHLLVRRRTASICQRLQAPSPSFRLESARAPPSSEHHAPHIRDP